MKKVRKSTTANTKFVQKWMKVVYINSSVIYLNWCGATMVLQAMSFLHKFPKRCGALKK